MTAYFDEAITRLNEEIKTIAQDDQIGLLRVIAKHEARAWEDIAFVIGLFTRDPPQLARAMGIYHTSFASLGNTSDEHFAKYGAEILEDYQDNKLAMASLTTRSSSAIGIWHECFHSIAQAGGLPTSFGRLMDDPTSIKRTFLRHREEEERAIDAKFAAKAEALAVAIQRVQDPAALAAWLLDLEDRLKTLSCNGMEV